MNFSFLSYRESIAPILPRYDRNEKGGGGGGGKGEYEGKKRVGKKEDGHCCAPDGVQQ